MKCNVAILWEVLVFKGGHFQVEALGERRRMGGNGDLDGGCEKEREMYATFEVAVVKNVGS